ncbi:hypothetical protein ACG04Q_05930 [Roseateles sp. DXS20W]|uniref:Uncharacterized protein n=1 Tax=Pelomonas lactea TaxID=3299030 RepID=A0ABW7GGL5_9BURK
MLEAAVRGFLDRVQVFGHVAGVLTWIKPRAAGTVRLELGQGLAHRPAQCCGP